MIYERWRDLKYKYRNRSFWCRGYYVDSVGNNKKMIEEYIYDQLKNYELIKNDELTGQLTFDTSNPFK